MLGTVKLEFAENDLKFSENFAKINSANSFCKLNNNNINNEPQQFINFKAMCCFYHIIMLCARYNV